MDLGFLLLPFQHCNWAFFCIAALSLYFALAYGLKALYNKNMFIDKQQSLSLIIIVAAAVTCFCYFLFFKFSSVIWGLKKSFPQEAFARGIRQWTLVNDGIEGYVLYAMTFLIIILSVALYALISRMSRSWHFVSSGVFLAIPAIIFATRVDFHVPFAPFLLPLTTPCYAEIFLIFCGLVLFLVYLIKKNAVLYPMAIAIILIPVCFIAQQPISLCDYSYIFAPALRMLYGAPLSEIYLQYDLLLSLLAALWMKLGLNLVDFSLIGQISLYLFLLGAALFTKKMLLTKHLSVVAVLSLLLFKCYSLLHDPVAIIQVTPLRLDLWIIPAGLMILYGARHWSVGASLGVLMILHRTFGMIYSAGYCQLIIVLFCLQCSSCGYSPGNLLRRCRQELLLFGRTYGVNLGCIIAGWCISCIIFGGPVNKSIGIYQNIGIGFIRIADESFYWYIPVLLASTAVLLVLLRATLQPVYQETAWFVVFCAIGNSLYFFGRSHEHNILNIAGILVILLFVFFDLLMIGISSYKGRNTLGRRTKKAVAVLLPFLFLSLSICYSERVVSGVKAQKANARKHQWIVPIPFVVDFAQIRSATNNSPNLYFLSNLDFYYYYFGNYRPVGFFSPHNTWVFKKDLTVFLQDLLNRGYFLIDDFGELEELKGNLLFGRYWKVERYSIMKR